MNTPQQEESPLHSFETFRASPTGSNTDPSNYSRVPGTKISEAISSLEAPSYYRDDTVDQLLLPSDQPSSPEEVPRFLQPLDDHQFTSQPPGFSSRPAFMSVYSASNSESESSSYSNPPARAYRVPEFQKMSTSRKITKAEKESMIEALNTHRLNTLVELRRIEKAFAKLGSPDCNGPMTQAWSYYVNSHSLLTEIRALTKNYPFSSDCLEEAKSRVYSDPQSNRSWNFCWLVLRKIKSDQLLPYYAQLQASQPAMWGNNTPSSEQVAQLTNAFVAEWNWAINQMLWHWEQAPIQ